MRQIGEELARQLRARGFKTVTAETHPDACGACRHCGSAIPLHSFIGHEDGCQEDMADTANRQQKNSS